MSSRQMKNGAGSRGEEGQIALDETRVERGSLVQASLIALSSRAWGHTKPGLRMAGDVPHGVSSGGQCAIRGVYIGDNLSIPIYSVCF